ncbi:MAG: hypothetical protein BWK78_04650 [Thiotrichaceae bacterium IS1]|nr:MAG: hypothetical protein BWK78_04650 [Thiotrichaceae bacterium IS1]
MIQLITLFLILVGLHLFIGYVLTPLGYWLVQRGGDFSTFLWVRLKNFCRHQQNFSFASSVCDYLAKMENFLFHNYHFVKEYVSGKKVFLRKLGTNLVMGLMVVVMLSVFQDTPVLMDMRDASMDWTMKMRQGDIPPRQDKGIPAFVLVDIDDETYKEWEYPLFTPRHYLKRLIERAVQAKARLIILDVDLSQNVSLLKSHEENALSAQEQELFDFIKNYKQTYCQQECPLIILTRTLLYPEQRQQAVFEPRQTFLDRAATESAPYVQWASALFYASDHDEVVRKWSLWQPTCTSERQPGALPSIELLAGAFIRNGTPQRTQEQLNKTLEPFWPKYCGDKYVVPQFLDQVLRIGELVINVDIKTTQDIHQRIMYSMPWQEDSRYRIICDQADCNATDKPPIFMSVSAKEYAKPTVSASLGILEGKVVVIGGSHSRSGQGDIHRTPLGDMPGAMIVVNSIHSLLQYPTFETVSVVWKLLTVAILTILMTLVFERYSSFVSMVLLGTVFILILLPASILLKFGIWGVTLVGSPVSPYSSDF